MNWIMRGAVLVFLSAIVIISTRAIKDPHVTRLLMQGDNCLDDEDAVGAEAAFAEVLRLQPKNVSALVGHGHALRLAGKNEQAFADFENAIRLEPKNPAGYCERAGLRSEKSVFKSALADCNEAIRLAPMSSIAYDVRGYVLDSKGEIDASIEDFDRAIRIDPGDNYAFGNRGHAYSLKGDWDRALADYSEVSRLRPKDADAREAQGLIWANKNDFARGEIELSQAIGLKPDRARYYAERAEIRESLHAYRTAIADWGRAIELDPKNAGYYVHRADDYTQFQQFDEVFADCEAALRLDAKNVEALDGRGYADLVTGNYARAISEESQAIRLRPGDHLAYRQRGDAYEYLKRVNEALADYTDAIALGSHDAYSYYSRGRLFAGKKDFQRAIADFDEAIHVDPQYVSAYYERAALYSDRGSLDKALADCSAAIRLQPDDARYLRLRYWLYEKLGDRVAARADFDRLRVLDFATLRREFGLRPAAELPKEALVALEQRLAAEVKGLEYDDQLARGLAAMVRDWDLVGMAQQLADARSREKKAQLPAAEVTKVERRVAERLARLVDANVEPYVDPTFRDDRGHELTDVVYDKIGCCQGKALLYFVLGRSVGLSAEGLAVSVMADGPTPDAAPHEACVVQLADGTMVMVDPTDNLRGEQLVSQPFRFHDIYLPCGDYWRLKDDSNPFGVHRVVQVQNVAGMVADLNAVRANTAMRRGDFTVAASKLDEALRHDAKCLNGYGNRGCLFEQTDMYDKAIENFTRASVLNPDDASAYAHRGWCRIQLGQFDEGIGDLQKSLALNPRLTEALMTRGEAYADRGDYDRALSDLNNAVEARPPSARAYESRSHVWQLKACQDVEYAVRSRQLAPASLAARRESKPWPSTHDELSSPNLLAAAVHGPEAEILDKYTASHSLPALDFDDVRERPPLIALPGEPDRPLVPIHLTVGPKLSLSTESSDAGYWASEARVANENALEDLNTAIRLAPTTASAYVSRAYVYETLEKFTSALSDLSEGIRLDATQADYFCRRGELHSQLGDRDKAIADLNKAIELDPSSESTRLIRDELVAQQAESEKAAAKPADADSDTSKPSGPKNALHDGTNHAGH